MDRIDLVGVRVHANHGVYAEERRDGQTFVLDVRVYLDLSRAATSDDVADTVHYGELAERVRDAAEGEPVDLIETLAERIAAVALAAGPVAAARVRVSKPDAPIAVPFDDVAVTILRFPGGGA